MIGLQRCHSGHAGKLEMRIQHAVKQIFPLPAIPDRNRNTADLMKEMKEFVGSLKSHRALEHLIRRAKRVMQSSCGTLHTGAEGDCQSGLQALQHGIERNAASCQRRKSGQQMPGQRSRNIRQRDDFKTERGHDFLKLHHVTRRQIRTGQQRNLAGIHIALSPQTCLLN
ncbi:hypothetical protein D3C72_1698550 [compost metagenome]